MSRPLAKGWVEIELGDHVYIAGRIGWRGLKAEEYTPVGPILLSVPNLNHGDKVNFGRVYHITQARYDESREIQLIVGDTLLVKDGAGIGKLGFVENLPGPTTVNSSLLVVRPANELLTNNYLFYYLKGPKFQEIALQRITGSATPHLFQKDIKKLQVLVPPRNEQRRIVAKLETLLSKVDVSQQRLAKIPALLKRFRQSVLAAACSGRLTADWRGNDESADDGFPPGWEQKTLDSIFTIRTGGTPSRQIPAYFEKGTIPWVKTSEVQNGDIIQTEEFITKRAVRESNAKIFPTGTLLVAMYGEGKTRGQIGRLTFPAATNQACAALINTSLPQTTNKYVLYYLLSQYYALRAQSVGGNQPNLNLGIVKDWNVPVPPLPEQEEIVRRVESLFALADRLEARFAEGRKRVDSITQSILAKAFRGELVPAEFELAKSEGRSFESAEELLERIKGNGQVKQTKTKGYIKNK